MRLIKFHEPFRIYNAGEVAGFSAEYAAELIKAGVGEDVTPPPPAPPAQAPVEALKGKKR